MLSSRICNDITVYIFGYCEMYCNIFRSLRCDYLKGADENFNFYTFFSVLREKPVKHFVARRGINSTICEAQTRFFRDINSPRATH